MRQAILTTLFVLCSAFLFAQTDTARLTSRPKDIDITGRAPQALYLGLGGSAPIFSFNYDRRFSKKTNGLGFAAGVGFFGIAGISIFSVPLSLNYLVGKNSHFLEIAGGTTFLSSRSKLFSNGDPSRAAFIFHINVGYRYQPAHESFFFRVGASPLYGGGVYATSCYLGFGYTF